MPGWLGLGRGSGYPRDRTGVDQTGVKLVRAVLKLTSVLSVFLRCKVRIRAQTTAPHVGQAELDWRAVSKRGC